MSEFGINHRFSAPSCYYAAPHSPLEQEVVKS
jgi:hypothetical protein